LETFVTKKRNAISLTYSKEAWRLLANNFCKVLSNPDDLEARGAMQLGACLAGLAIENSMLGGSHATANPLTANYGIVHGQAVALMLPHVVRFNGEKFAPWYEELYNELTDETVDDVFSADKPSSGPDGIAGFITALLKRTNLSTTLTEAGVDRERIAGLAESAEKEWTGGFNPRPLNRKNLEQLYEQAY
ncbi:MAG: iron-containing alcohol dehydrogenase, partial [Pirellulaceae bacterium]|nr:iron-containing alcohol dehydrogenase [Pirellulaceae bacterium]